MTFRQLNPDSQYCLVLAAGFNPDILSNHIVKQFENKKKTYPKQGYKLCVSNLDSNAVI